MIRLYILKNSQKQKLKLGRTCSDDITGVLQDLCPFIYVIYHWLPGTWQTSGLEQLLLKTIRIQWWTLQVNHLGYVPTHLKKKHKCASRDAFNSELLNWLRIFIDILITVKRLCEHKNLLPNAFKWAVENWQIKTLTFIQKVYERNVNSSSLRFQP